MALEQSEKWLSLFIERYILHGIFMCTELNSLQLKDHDCEKVVIIHGIWTIQADEYLNWCQRMVHILFYSGIKL